MSGVLSGWTHLLTHSLTPVVVRSDGVVYGVGEMMLSV